MYNTNEMFIGVFIFSFLTHLMWVGLSLHDTPVSLLCILFSEVHIVELMQSCPAAKQTENCIIQGLPSLGLWSE